MALFAVLDENNIVINTIVCESQGLADELTGRTCIQYNIEQPAAIGYAWDGANFEQPEKVVHDPRMLEFTQEEREALEATLEREKRERDRRATL
jgi:hypothetical protein